MIWINLSLKGITRSGIGLCRDYNDCNQGTDKSKDLHLLEMGPPVRLAIELKNLAILYFLPTSFPRTM